MPNIPIRSMREISADIVQWWRFRTAGLTYFGQGVAAGLADAVARPLQHLEKLRYDGILSMLVDTATGTDLDALGVERGGLTRGVASGSSAPVVLQGTPGAEVPSGTQLGSVSGIVYTTQNAVTIGTANPLLLGESGSLSLGDTVMVQSTTAGQSTNVPAYTINSLISSVSGIDAVFNPIAATGGADAESDELFRARIKARPALSAQGTAAFLEALAQAEPTLGAQVLRATVVRTDGATVYLVRNTGAPFTVGGGGELETISNYMQPRLKAIFGLTTANLTFAAVDVQSTVDLNPGYTMQEAFVEVSDAIANYIDWQTWTVGANVDLATLLARVADAASVRSVDEAGFIPAADVQVGGAQIPRLTSCTLTSVITGEVVGGSLNQQFL